MDRWNDKQCIAKSSPLSLFSFYPFFLASVLCILHHVSFYVIPGYCWSKTISYTFHIDRVFPLKNKPSSLLYVHTDRVFPLKDKPSSLLYFHTDRVFTLKDKPSSLLYFYTDMVFPLKNKPSSLLFLQLEWIPLKGTVWGKIEAPTLVLAPWKLLLERILKIIFIPVCFLLCTIRFTFDEQICGQTVHFQILCDFSCFLPFVWLGVSFLPLLSLFFLVF